MKKVIRRFLHIYPRMRSIFYKSYNKLYFWAHGISYGRRMRVYNDIGFVSK